MSSPAPFSDSDEDLETLRRARSITSAALSTQSDSDTDASGEDDVHLLRRLQERFAAPDSPHVAAAAAGDPFRFVRPLAVRGLDGDDDDDDYDFETLRAIKRRFAQYDDGQTVVNHKEEAETIDNHPEEDQALAGVTTKSEAPDTLSMSEKCIVETEEVRDLVALGSAHGEEEVRDSVALGSFHGVEEMHNIDGEAYAHSEFPKSARYFIEALKKNRSCQKFMRRKLIEIEAKIEENKQLRGRIKCLMDFQAFCNRNTGRMLSQEKDPHIRLISCRKPITEAMAKNRWKKVLVLRLGPAENSHVSKYKMTLKRFPISFCKPPWTELDDDNLEKGLKQQYQEMLILNSMNPESGSGDSGDTHAVPAISSSDLEVTDEKIRSVLPLVNWDRLASMYLTGRSGAECESRWLNCKDSIVNKDPWSLLEDKRLLYYVQERGLYNWIDIAIALGTQRTPFQCLVRYQRSLNPHILNRDWTDEDDAKLRAAVEAFGYDWQTVASHVEGRSGSQCSNRWRISLHPERKKVGRWSIDEDKRLKVAVTIFGAKNWNKIALFAPGRTQVQCRERWLNCLNPSLNLEPWTQEEDDKLLAAISEHDYSWSKVANCVPPRTDNQCRRRWKILRPHEVPVLQATKKIKQTALISNFVGRESERPLIGPNDFSAPVLSQAAEDAKNMIARQKSSRRGLLKKSIAQPKRSKRNLIAVDMANSSEIPAAEPSPVPGLNSCTFESGCLNRIGDETKSRAQPKKSVAKPKRSRKKNLVADDTVNSWEIPLSELFPVLGLNSSTAESGSLNMIRNETSSHIQPKKRGTKNRNCLEGSSTTPSVNTSSGIAPGVLQLTKTGKKRLRNSLPKEPRAEPRVSRVGSVFSDGVNSSCGIAPTVLSIVPVVSTTTNEKISTRKSMKKLARCRMKSGSSLEETLTTDASNGDLCLKPSIKPSSAGNGSMKKTMEGISSDIAPTKSCKKPGSAFDENIMTDAMIVHSSNTAPSNVPGENSTSFMNVKRTRKKKSRSEDFYFY